MFEENSLGETLKLARERMGWKQEQLATKLHPAVSRGTVSRWEHNVHHPSAYHLKQLFSILGLSEKDVNTSYRAAEQEPPIIDTLPIQPNPDIPSHEEYADTLHRTVEQEPPKIRHLPPRNPFFTGRETYLKQLRNFLQDNGTVALTQPISISGLGGIGKTQLALAYAYDCYPNMYRVVLWVNAADPTTLQAGYESIAERPELPELNELKPHQRVQAVKQWLEEHTNWLLILDNADDLQLARSFFPECDHRRILLTTRSPFAGKIGARPLEINKMEPEEGLVFLLRRSGVLAVDANPDTVAVDIREPARQLVELLDGHPLALDQAGAYIEETDESFPEYINLYQNQRRRFLGKYGALESEPSEQPEYSQHPETVVVTFELCFEKARERDRLADDILHFCAFLSPDDIPEELFQHDESFKVDRDTFNGGIAALQRYSLIKRDSQEKLLSMHRLVQVVLIEGMLPDQQRQWRERVVQTLNAAFPERGLDNWGQYDRLLPHALVCTTWAEDKLDPPVEVAKLFMYAGFYLGDRGQFAEAERLQMRVLSILEQHFGVEHPYSASTQRALADLYVHQGKYEQAEPLLVRALSIHENHSGAENYWTVMCIESLAVLYHMQHKFEQAEPLYLQALAVQEKYLGDMHPETFRILDKLAQLYIDEGKYDEAEPLYLQALAVQENQLGATHRDTLTSLYKLADLYIKQHNFELAESRYLQALAVQENHFGTEYPEIAHILIDLAFLYMMQDKYEEVAPLCQRALAIQEKHLDAEDPVFATVLYGLVVLLHFQSQHKQADALYQRIISILERRLGPTYPTVLLYKRDYPGLLHRLEHGELGAAMREVFKFSAPGED